MAFVTLHPQHQSEWQGKHDQLAADLKRYAKSRLPGFACPEWIEVVPELPVGRKNHYISDLRRLQERRSR